MMQVLSQATNGVVRWELACPHDQDIYYIVVTDMEQNRWWDGSTWQTRGWCSNPGHCGSYNGIELHENGQTWAEERVQEQVQAAQAAL
jgi:hypothetical protein